MTSRERVKAALRFERPDRLPRNDAPWTQTIARWRAEGLPDDVAVADYFDFDIAMMFIDPSPRFEMKVLKREGGFITYEDRYGYTMRKEEHGEGTIDFIAHRNTGREAWAEAVRPRLVLSDDPTEPARLDDSQYFAHFAPYPSWAEAVEKYRRLYARGRYVLFMCYGPWEAAWRHRGMEELLVDSVQDPGWVDEMGAVHVDLVVDILKRCLDLGARPDGILWAEDLGTSIGPMFSPSGWDDFLRPHYRRFGEFLRREGIDFWLHSDGRIHEYVPRFIDVGVQVLNPLEVKAGMDAVQLREQFGRNLAYYGNISAQRMAGSRSELDEELRRKIPVAREGGYIMHSDHSVPPEVSLAQYRWMQDRAQEIFEGTVDD
jgi:uroporphyrinogen decarboxylase